MHVHRTPLEGSSYGRLAETSLPARCKTIHYRGDLRPRSASRSLRYTFIIPRAECPIPWTIHRTTAFKFLRKSIDRTKKNNHFIDWKYLLLPLDAKTYPFQKLVVLLDQASKSPKETLSNFPIPRITDLPIGKKNLWFVEWRRWNNERRSRKLIIRGGKGNDNYSLDKSRWEQRRPLPLARKMASVSGYVRFLEI